MVGCGREQSAPWIQRGRLRQRPETCTQLTRTPGGGAASSRLTSTASETSSHGPSRAMLIMMTAIPAAVAHARDCANLVVGEFDVDLASAGSAPCRTLGTSDRQVT